MRCVLRRVVALSALVLLLPSAAAAASFSRATAETTAAGTARFTIDIAASLSGGGKLTTRSRGTVDFARRRAHIYKLVPNEPVPEEQIVSGNWTYANSNVTAALGNPAAKPWTKVDTRLLSPKRRVGELEAARVLAYLPAGVAKPRRVGMREGLTHYRGVVDTARLLRSAPRAQRQALGVILRAEYAAKPFPADFWLDAKSRLRRVHVAYAAQGMRFSVAGSYTGFGVHVDVTPPPARETSLVTP